MERSHDKLRPALPRLKDQPAAGTARDRDGDHGPGGHFTNGNQAAQGRGWKRAIRKSLAAEGIELAAEELVVLVRDQRALYAALLAALPSDGPLVRLNAAALARNAVLAHYFALRALEHGPETEAGAAADARSVLHDQRVERLSATTYGLAARLAGPGKRPSRSLEQLVRDAAKPRGEP